MGSQGTKEADPIQKFFCAQKIPRPEKWKENYVWIVSREQIFQVIAILKFSLYWGFSLFNSLKIWGPMLSKSFLGFRLLLSRALF
jgi:hypothetical protein